MTEGQLRAVRAINHFNDGRADGEDMLKAFDFIVDEAIRLSQPTRELHERKGEEPEDRAGPDG